MSTIIIGGGTFGLSTALHLLRKDPEHKVQVIDPYPIPSPLSAGNDVNKILQSSSKTPFYGKLALDAQKRWKEDPVFSKQFNETGIVYGSKIADELKESREFKLENGLKIKDITSSEGFGEYIPSIDPESDSQRFPGWTGFYQEDQCGWTMALGALNSCAEEITKLGGSFIVDSAEEILYDEDGAVTGVRCFSGDQYDADKVVIAAGAQSYKFLDFQGQLLAKCWTVGHIKLSEEEAKIMKKMPVLLSYDHGFFFEPDFNNELKFCNEFPGYINMDKTIGESVPLYKNQVPKEAEVYMRKFLAETFPSLAKRPFSVAKICWCTDTPTRDFLIGVHPEHPGLILGTGDSGQGFKFMPIIGDFISEVVLRGDEGLDEEKRTRWKWRPESAKNRDIYDVQLRSGGINVVKDLKDVQEWTDGKSPEELLADLKL